MTGPSAAAITVLGSINMDLVVTTAFLPQPGQTLLGKGFATICGGKGANQAIAAARAGGQVRLIGAVGDDGFGTELVANLVANGVLTGYVRRHPGPSGIAAIAVDDNAENTIVVVSGANGSMRTLTAGEQEVLGESALVVCQLEIPMDTVVHAGAIVAANGKPLLLNPSPVQTLSWALLSNTAMLVLNEGEAADLGAAAVADVQHVITTLGAAGAHYRGPDGQQFTVPAPAVRAIDTTGAGDAFTGALAVAWVEGKPALRSVQWACAAGALAATTAGASVSAPSRSAIDELVAATY
jgi:ribokinase